MYFLSIVLDRLLTESTCSSPKLQSFSFVTFSLSTDRPLPKAACKSAIPIPASITFVNKKAEYGYAITAHTPPVRWSNGLLNHRSSSAAFLDSDGAKTVTAQHLALTLTSAILRRRTMKPATTMAQRCWFSFSSKILHSTREYTTLLSLSCYLAGWARLSACPLQSREAWRLSTFQLGCLSPEQSLSISAAYPDLASPKLFTIIACDNCCLNLCDGQSLGMTNDEAQWHSEPAGPWHSQSRHCDRNCTGQ